MGLFDRFFRKDPQKTLERAESFLARGEAVEALRLAERTMKGASLAQANRAESLVRRAKEALVAAALEKAELAEASGFYEDAAEWIEAALDHAKDEDERAGLQSRTADLMEKRRAADRFEIREAQDGGDGEDAGAAAGVPDLDLRYEALVNTLDDDVAQRYEERPEAFRRAYVQLNEGEVQAARTALEELAETHPDDPVYLLERGRARLLTGDFPDARDDFERVWETFGDEPLDHARSFSVPGMWSEAMLGAGDAEAVLERLDEVAVPREGDHVLCHNYALAFIVTKRLEEAREYLAEAMNYFSQPEFSHQLATVLFALGRTSEAIDTLERAIAPSCSPAGCRRVPKHVPSLRFLAALYLGEGRGFGRVEDLLSHIAQAQGGRLEAEDHQLLAKYYEKQGDDEAAAEASAKARQLEPGLS